MDNRISFTLDNSILENDKNPYGDPTWLMDKLKKLPKFPQAFICANDFIAITLIKTLKQMGYSIPNDISVCGFDDSIESRIVEPRLTTITIPSSQMGDMAANLLMSRIKDPSIPYTITHVKTSILYGDSALLSQNN